MQQSTSLQLFARDPGSANQILALKELLDLTIEQKQTELGRPLAALLEKLTKGLSISQIRVAANGVALTQLREAGLTAEDWKAVNNVETATKKLITHKIGCLVTGLSDRDDRTPQILWSAAGPCGTQTLALLDDTTVANPVALSDLDERFKLADGSRVLPDTIGVINSTSRDALAEIGIPLSTIIVIGHLHLNRFRRLAANTSGGRVAELRRSWGVTSDTNVILFASEPLSEMTAYGKHRSENEFSCLKQLIRRVQEQDPITVGSTNKPTTIIVRPHPRESINKFSKMQWGQRPQIIVSREGTSAEAILASDSVFGLSSMILVEAASVGRSVHSLIDFDPQAAARGL